MDTTAITNFFKKAAKNLASGVASAVSSTDDVKLVPAIAPIPIREVDDSYGTTEPIEKPEEEEKYDCLLYTSPSPRDGLLSRMPSSA